MGDLKNANWNIPFGGFLMIHSSLWMCFDRLRCVVITPFHYISAGKNHGNFLHFPQNGQKCALFVKKNGKSLVKIQKKSQNVLTIFPSECNCVLSGSLF